MKKRSRGARVAAVAAALLATAVQPAPATPVPGAPACPMFPSNSFWHADISALPRDGASDTYVDNVSATAALKADFGAGLWDGGPIGIPYVVVPGAQPKVPISFYYGSQSDPGPYPIPANAPIEGGPGSDGDRHVLIVDKDACRLYEVFDAHPNPDGSWWAGSGATWSLTSNALRPAEWTSADAAGLSILPGLVRYDEILSGEIDHAIRVTVPITDDRYIWPARHEASGSFPGYPPMGLRFRLKADFDISGFSPTNRIILRALKRYGMIVADNGSAWFMSGVPDERWDNDDLHVLRTIAGSSFEAVDASSLMLDPDSGAVRTARRAPGDFDGDGDTDRAVFRPSTGVWYVASPPASATFGTNGDVPVPADYDGDGNADHAVFRPSTGVWYLNGNTPAATVFGVGNDIPVPADYDGDGRADMAVFRPSNGVWYIQSPASATAFGTSGDIPVPGDYNGDGRAELAVFRPSSGAWYLNGSPASSVVFGVSGDIPVPGDYDGDGTTDVAVFRPSTNVWYVRTPASALVFGVAGDEPQPGDYNGDGRTDVAVFRPSTGVWYVQSPPSAVVFGTSGDRALPLPEAIGKFFF